MQGEVSTVELVVPRCAGLDVAKDEVVACVRVPDGRGGRRQEVCTYPTFPAFTWGLGALADWLAAEAVTQVVLGGAGGYRPVLEAGVVCVGGAGFPAAVGQRPPRQDRAWAQDRRG
jgi:hypothetical protein